MTLERRKSLDDPIEVDTFTRPIKVAYLVPYDESLEGNLVLDAVFYESYTRWAGGYTLIVPTNASGFLHPTYEEWLQFFDPDFLYSYVDLEESAVRKIDALICPIAFLKHKTYGRRPERPDWRQFVPNSGHYFRAVSSESAVQGPYSPFPIRGQPASEVTVLTEYGFEAGQRTIRDNFGIAFHTLTVTHGVEGLYRTLCLTPPDLPKNVGVGTERVGSLAEAMGAVASRRAVPIARFAVAYSDGIPTPEPWEWARAFNIFVGKTVLDRVHFWNARHLSPSHSAIPSTLIIDKDLFEDSEFIKQVGAYLNGHNFLGGNGPHEVSLRSYSHSVAELRGLQEKFAKCTYNMVSVPKTFDQPAVPSSSDDYKRGRLRRATDTSVLKLTEEANILLASAPSHFTYIPPRYRGVTSGQWMVELSIQRHNNLSKYSNVVDRWALPRRKRITRAFTRNPAKVTSAGGRLAVLPTTENFPFDNFAINKEYSYGLTLPSDEDFFRYLVMEFLHRYPEDDLRATLTNGSYKELALSDKGQNFRGVISMFGGLHDTYQILTRRVWREILRAANPDSTKYLSFTQDDLHSFLPNDNPTKDKLRTEWRLEDLKTVNRYLRAGFTDTLEYLIGLNVFFQVHQWRCRYCGHMNSRSFDQMKVKNQCDICSTEHVAPIDLEWSYQLNEFVYRALVKQHGLTVLWALGYLHDEPHSLGDQSFWYLPEVDLFEDPDTPDNKKNEVDSLYMLGGKFGVLEAKRSASLFVGKPGEKDKFLSKVGILRPDVAVLAFERYCGEDQDAGQVKSALAKLIAEIKPLLPAITQLRVLVASEIAEFNEYSADSGITGSRSIALSMELDKKKAH